VINVKLTSMFRVGRVMISLEHWKIINVASLQNFVGSITIPAYTASKGGVVQIMRAMTNERARWHANVNALTQGYILTDLTRTL
jgi:2-deoxy-D-gluconate 3-dehydrogenase